MDSNDAELIQAPLSFREIGIDSGARVLTAMCAYSAEQYAQRHGLTAVGALAMTIETGICLFPDNIVRTVPRILAFINNSIS